MFLATQRAAYAAERSTFDGSLPENAPPPWRAQPPYVSTMILRPVRPQSPTGPPITNLPVGLMWNFVPLWIHLVGSTGLMTSSITPSFRSLYLTDGSCCVERTTASIATALSFS